MDRILSTWAGLASHFIGECFDAAKPYLDQDYDAIDPYVRFVSAQLFIDCHLSSESSLLLVQTGKEWDADLINRSVLEGTIKYIFLMHGNSDQVRQKAIEFWEKLPLFASIRRSDRARSFLDVVGNHDSSEWIPIKDLVLSDDDISRIKGESTKKERRSLDQKWSFSEITKGFAASDSEELKCFIHLSHGYGMSSRLIHKDGDGVGMVWERYRRSADEQVSVKLGHSARIVSDICTFSKMRLYRLLRFCGQDVSKIQTIEERYKDLFDELQTAERQFIQAEYPEVLNE